MESSKICKKSKKSSRAGQVIDSQLYLVNSRGPPKNKFFISPIPGSWILVPRSWYQDLDTKILVPKSRYQNLGTRILVPGSQYQDLGTKIHGESERRSLSVCRGARGLQAPRQVVWGAGSPPSKNNFMDPEPGPNS